ncbi:MAG: hypothetical protein JWN56_2263 [Sphingobacteriales bacterium]|nr:hypothetical protein [Sphingobacteriales bacterium]
MKGCFKTCFIYVCILGCVRVYGQTIPVGFSTFEDFYRREQLLGKADSNFSFTSRPFFPTYLQDTSDVFYPENEINNIGQKGASDTWHFSKGFVKLLPVNWKQQYNSDHPYGWNDGVMIPSKGYQTSVSAGIFVKLGVFSIQLQPEYVYAKNEEFDGFPTEQTATLWAAYYNEIHNKIDMPERFGESSFNRLSFGQSSIRLTVGSISFGLSNENLWWGPGIRNSLIMSNSAAGFKHITFNTVKAIKTKIGSFEGQLVSGKLEGSGFTPPEINRVFNQTKLYIPKSTDWRYFSGFVLSYHPKWVPGLFLGISRAYTIYNGDMSKGFNAYLPIVSDFFKQNSDNDEMDLKRQRLSSIFGRWVLPESHAEIYFEYGRNNKATSLKDFILTPDHSRAYIIGTNVLVPFRQTANTFLQFNLELTQLQNSSLKDSRPTDTWYTSNYVRHGYTNKGEMLGAGIGPGSNLQSGSVAWVRGIKRVGIRAERYVHNNDFYDSAFGAQKDYHVFWTDMSISTFAEWNYRNLLINANVCAIRSLNYEWNRMYFQQEGAGLSGLEEGRDVFNFQGQLGITYRF